MQSFLLGLPGKVKTLLDRLTFDRAGYLDYLTALANSLLNAPIAANFPSPATAGSGAAFDFRTIMACELATTTSTTLVDAVNITGSGELNFLAIVSGSFSHVQVIIDGVTIIDFTCTGTAGALRVPVGAASGDTARPSVAFEHIPFKTSLVIKHRVTSSGTTSTYYKLRRTS